MDIEKISITDIKPADYNPRQISKDELQKLTNSINEFGLVDPIIINLQNNKIIGGHQRYEVLLNKYMLDGEFKDNNELYLLRFGDIGWAFTSTDMAIKSEEHEKALNLALNKISGEWDLPKLNILLDELDMSGFDIRLTGFELEDLNVDDLLDGLTEDETGLTEHEQDEYLPDEEITVNVKIGDKYKLGRHTLRCGDSSQMDNINDLLQEAQIDLILTDAPYGINIVNVNGEVSAPAAVGFDDTRGEVGVEGMVKARKYKPVLNDDKPFNPELILQLNAPSILFGANNFSSKLPDNPKWLVWCKKPLNAAGETINTDNGFSDVELAWTNLKGKSCNIYHYLWSGLLREGSRDLELMARVHPTQKPVGLLINILNDYSKENDNILDLYGGSGSTLIACEETNRNCYMMELDPYYCQVIINRWEDFTGQNAELISTEEDAE
jgi:16S rRNA G966 N2-methylase RsmD